MLIPELPEYLTQLGGPEYKGLIISLFTVTALLSRPFSGKLADKVGRVPVIMFGSIVCFVCSMVYPVLSSVTGFLVLRLVHGFSTGFTPTGTAAYLSDIIPAQRRGEAMGLFGTAGSVGMASGPAIGGTLANHFGLNSVFYCSSALALISVLIIIRIKETLKENHAFKMNFLKVNKADLFDKRVLAPCLVMVFLVYAYGSVLTLIPDFGEYVGIRNKGLLFTYMTVASILIRLVAGQASDRWGREAVLRVTSTFIIVALLIMAFSEAPLQLSAGMFLYGLAQGATSPTLIAWATDLSDPQNKGRGVASLYIFMEFGIGFGALASGLIYGNHPERLGFSFIVCCISAGIALVYLLARRYIWHPKNTMLR